MSVHLVAGEMTSALEARHRRWHAVDVSFLSEQGKARPRGKNLAAIAALRGVGKREVVERLGALKSGRQS
jgi:hypothetical protein